MTETPTTPREAATAEPSELLFAVADGLDLEWDGFHLSRESARLLADVMERSAREVEARPALAEAAPVLTAMVALALALAKDGIYEIEPNVTATT